MRHSNRVKKFGRERNQRKALMRSLSLALIRDRKICTTEAKAKALRPIAERLITLACRETPAASRLFRSRLGTTTSLQKYQKSLVEKYKMRRGGYTRIVKTGRRGSDGSKMAVIELVENAT